MKTECCICGKEIYLSIDEFLLIDQDLDKDLFCDDCVVEAIVFCSEYQLNSN